MAPKTECVPAAGNKTTGTEQAASVPEYESVISGSHEPLNVCIGMVDVISFGGANVAKHSRFGERQGPDNQDQVVALKL